MLRRLVALGFAIGLVAGVVAESATSAAGATTHRYRGAGKSTLTVPDAVSGAFTIDGTARIMRVGLTTVHGDGMRAADGTASYTLTFTTPTGETFITSNTATGFRLGRMGVFRARGLVAGGTGAFAGASGGISTVGGIMKAKASPGGFRARLVFVGLDHRLGPRGG